VIGLRARNSENRSGGGVPPPPWSCGIRELRGNSRKIFGFKELIDKIFRTKDLAPGILVLGIRPARLYNSLSVRRNRSQVTHECDGLRESNVHGQEQKQDSTFGVVPAEGERGLGSLVAPNGTKTRRMFRVIISQASPVRTDIGPPQIQSPPTTVTPKGRSLRSRSIEIPGLKRFDCSDPDLPIRRYASSTLPSRILTLMESGRAMTVDRGRDSRCWLPPAQTRTGAD
jgi:hypothetical protein